MFPNGVDVAIEIKQSLKLSQQLVMTPQLQQAIKLLQLNRIELLEHIHEEMLENPVLEENMESPEPGEVVAQPVVETPAKNETGEEFNLENYLQNYRSLPSQPAAKYIDDEMPSFENLMTKR